MFANRFGPPVRALCDKSALQAETLAMATGNADFTKWKPIMSNEGPPILFQHALGRFLHMMTVPKFAALEHVLVLAGRVSEAKLD